MENLQELIEQEFEYKLPEGLMSVDDYMKPYRILETAVLTKLLTLTHTNGSKEEIEDCKKQYEGFATQGLASFLQYVKDSIKVYK